MITRVACRVTVKAEGSTGAGLAAWHSCSAGHLLATPGMGVTLEWTGWIEWMPLKTFITTRAPAVLKVTQNDGELFGYSHFEGCWTPNC